MSGGTISDLRAGLLDSIYNYIFVIVPSCSRRGGNIAIVKEKEFTPRSKMKLCGEVLV